MSDVPKYAVFYGDGTVVEGGGDDTDDEWVEVTLRIPRIFMEAPPDNVQAVVVANPYTCRYVWEGNDYYYWVPNGEACSTDSIGEYLRGFVPSIKYGLCLTQEQYDDMRRRLRDYERIPRNGKRKAQIDVD